MLTFLIFLKLLVIPSRPGTWCDVGLLCLQDWLRITSQSLPARNRRTNTSQAQQDLTMLLEHFRKDQKSKPQNLKKSCLLLKINALP